MTIRKPHMKGSPHVSDYLHKLYAMTLKIKAFKWNYLNGLGETKKSTFL